MDLISKLFVALLLGWSGCTGLALELTPSDVPADDVGSPLDIVWTYNARAGFGPDAVLLFDGHVLVSTRQGEVHVIDAQTGKRAGVKRFGEAVNGRPVVLNNILVVPLAWGRRALAAFDMKQSKFLWRVRGAPIQTGLVAIGEDVITINLDGQVQRYRGSSGQLVWESTIPVDRTAHARPVLHEDLLLVADDGGGVTALDSDGGMLVWQAQLFAPVYATPVVDNGRLFVPTTRGRLYALDLRSGSVLWEAALRDTTVRIAPPAAEASQVIAGASDGRLRAWNATTGLLMWSIETPDALVAKPLLTSRLVYFGSMGGVLYVARREDGHMIQEIELRGRIKSAIALESQGLIVLTEPRYVVKLGPKKPESATL